MGANLCHPVVPPAGGHCEESFEELFSPGVPWNDRGERSGAHQKESSEVHLPVTKTQTNDSNCSTDFPPKPDSPNGVMHISSEFSIGEESEAQQKASHALETELPVEPVLTIDAAAVVELARHHLPGEAFSPWQKQFCTQDNVDLYRQSRPHSASAAAEALAAVLVWREQYQAVLTGEKQVRWASDMRVFTRGCNGHPIIIMSFRSQIPDASVQDTREHCAAVFEAAVQSMTSNASTFDFVLDCHGFKFNANLGRIMDPRKIVSIMEMLQNPYRDRLRCGLIVDAPATFHVVWNTASQFLTASTLTKLSFVKLSQAHERMASSAGPMAAESVVQAIVANRDPHAQLGPLRRPSEL